MLLKNWKARISFDVLFGIWKWRREIALCFSESTEMHWRVFVFPPSLRRRQTLPAPAPAPLSNWSAPRFSIKIALTLHLVPRILAIQGALSRRRSYNYNLKFISIDVNCYHGSNFRIVFSILDPYSLAFLLIYFRWFVNTRRNYYIGLEVLAFALEVRYSKHEAISRRNFGLVVLVKDICGIVGN